MSWHARFGGAPGCSRFDSISKYLDAPLVTCRVFSLVLVALTHGCECSVDDTQNEVG
jgi:hypothetical protein